ncbi:amidohydrolase [Fusibacter sp. 3D3]|uniref:amidohydrolase n=1 Tax=Fusibacter sp. 3D3 TaxID=1048380 RepID=UPI0008537105|nr:amidohydrolase [Fusibacter sp. 3D3]GAU76433.1 precursor of exoenzymes regulatory protein AepA [Fusibacter sp. 3D3]
MKRLFYNGKIASLDSNNTFYEAIGIKDSKIIFLGLDTEAQATKSEYDERIDLHGKTVVPGFNDSHIHLLNTGYAMTMLNLDPFNSIENIIDGTLAFIKTHAFSSEMWLLGRGWNQDKLKEKRYPTRADLDRISHTIPIIFTRACGHIAVCNTVALNTIGMNSLDTHDENINTDKGLFQEDALNALYAAVPSPSKDEIKDMILKASNALLKQGVTSVQSDDLCCMPDRDYEKVLQAYHELNHEKKLPVRVYQQCLFFEESDFEAFAKKHYRTGQGDAFFKIGPVKLLLDGSLGARTALLREPYSDDLLNSGIACFEQNELNRLIQRTQHYGFQVAAHCIGDKAMDMFVEALKNVPSFNKEADHRHGIVHAQVMTPDIIRSMSDLHLLAYIQPIFLDYDLHIVDNRLSHRANNAYAFKTMLESNIKLCFGTDAPVVDYNPFENIYTAVVRKDLNNQPETPYLITECLTVNEALKAYTLNGAYSAFEELYKGTLELGKLADFVIIDQDIFSIDPIEIKNISILMTVLDGQIAYEQI